MIVYFLVLILGLLIGGALFMLLPVVWNSTKIGHKYVWLAMFGVRRGAFVLQDDGKLNFKKFKYDPIGSEKVTIGDDVITLSDPARALQTFKGKTLAFADETHGIIYRISDAAAGTRKQELTKQGDIVGNANASDYDIQAWIRKYLKIETNSPIDLRDVRYLATGTESGSDSWLARTWYKFSRIRENSGASALKLLIPVAAFAITLIILWQAQGQSGGSEASTGSANNSTTLNMLWLTLMPIGQRGKVLLGCICIFAGLVLAYILFGLAIVGYPIALGIGIALGFAGMAGAVLLMSLVGMGAWCSTFFLDMGLQTFDNPTLVEGSDGITLIDRYVGKPGHKLGKHRITFIVSEVGVESRTDYAGTENDIIRSEESNGPKKKPKEGGEQFGHFIPKFDPSNTNRYVSTFGAISSLRDGFIGKDTDERHKEAKEEFGDGISDVSSKLIIGATFGAILLAAGIGWFLL